MYKDVFISYSSKEIEICSKVCSYLEENNISCWIAPRDVNPGGNYATQIVEAIRDCSILVLLASDSTNASGHVSNEVGLAFDNKKTIIPFKIQDVKFSDEYMYFLGRKHWIEAHLDLNSSFSILLATINKILEKDKNKAEVVDTATATVTSNFAKSIAKSHDEINENLELSREDIISCFIEKNKKYSCSHADHLQSEDDYQRLKTLANKIFAPSMKLTYLKKAVDAEDKVDFLVRDLLSDSGSDTIKIMGLPGSAKNLVLQLVFYKIASMFRNHEIDYLPFYVSMNFFEKAKYKQENTFEQMKSMINRELMEFRAFLKNHPNIKPIIFVDTIREHNIGKVAAENVFYDQIKELGSFKRMVAIDTGLIKNKRCLKRVIPIASQGGGYVVQTEPVNILEEAVAQELIKNVLEMYDFQVEPTEVLSVIKKLNYQDIDVFTVKLIAQEILTSFDVDGLTVNEIYEKLALSELLGHEDKLFQISKLMHQYTFDWNLCIEDLELGSQWSLIHKHHTFLEFLTAYYFVRCIDKYEQGMEIDFFRAMLAASSNKFVVCMLNNNYTLQEKMFNFVINNYERFNVFQKSNAAYWLGRITYKNLSIPAINFLSEKFAELQPLVKHNNKTNQENLHSQFLFRSICTGLIFHGKIAILDDYLSQIVTNDVANAINRGATIEYYDDYYQMAANESLYLDTNLNIGEKAIKVLIKIINEAISGNSKRYVEVDLVTLFSLLQSRIQDPESRPDFDIREYLKQAVSILNGYLSRPQNIKKRKIEYYLKSIYEDFKLYLEVDGDFDIGRNIYDKYRSIKDVKRPQWLARNVDDPESVSEHTFSAWLLAMLFLPEELNYDDYNKREVLDMLLIHDLAEAQISSQVSSVDEPNKDLKLQDEILRKLFLKGTYPNLSNLTYYYNVWTGYYNGTNTNAKIARDINLTQTVYTFCEYYSHYPELFSADDVSEWLAKKSKLITEVGYQIFEQLIDNNTGFSLNLSDKNA